MGVEYVVNNMEETYTIYDVKVQLLYHRVVLKYS